MHYVGWDIILAGWRWVEHYFGWVGVGALFDNVHIKWKTYFNTEHFFHIFPTLQLITGVPPNTF